MKPSLAVLITTSLAITVFPNFVHADSAPGYLPDYQYQVANVSNFAEAQTLFDSETKDTRKNSICSNRADIWSYIMQRDHSVNVGKVFIHFTKEGQADENKQWAYHVAPYVLIKGVEYVLDSAFGVFDGQPVRLTDWTNYFGKSSKCVVLDPTHNPNHLNLEKNNLPNDRVTPLTYVKGGARQYPPTEGICYIRKVPMYYVYPLEVYGADLYLTGHSEYSKFFRTDFDKEELLGACQQAMTLFARVSKSCKNYLGL